jgi:hypothetical protein
VAGERTEAVVSFHKLLCPRISVDHLGPFQWKAYVAMRYYVTDTGPEFGHDIREFVAIKWTRRAARKAAEAELAYRRNLNHDRPGSGIRRQT